MPAARQAVDRQDSREVTRPGSPTYQMASWSSAVATTAAVSVPSQTLVSCRARARP